MAYNLRKGASKWRQKSTEERNWA